MSSVCHCGSGKLFEECCGPILAGKEKAITAEALMRSRYSAYAMGKIEYLGDTLHPDNRHDHDVDATRRWAMNSEWLNLEIGVTEAGGKEDDKGTVEFTATFKEKGIQRKHHENSRFEKLDGAWYYVDGDLIAPETQVRDAPKVGRNEPCPCGSGKKFKKCCG
ncbi:MAG: YchJ family protein [Candidatus Polarisedimenticolaceae bacterium]|nr:YchJ family protein [Candidatus Polarisedimenticolaceae bacterium]